MDLIDDQTGLPSEKFLQSIREWPKGAYTAMMAEIERAWRNVEFIHDDSTIFVLHTRGWEGNEQIIEAMHDNVEFWANCWVSSNRAGEHEFDVLKGW